MVYAVKDKADFQKQLELAGDKVVLVDFFATWCGPCRVIAPKLEELAKQYSEQIVVLKVDVDECEEIAMEYEISSMPTFIFLKNGQKVDEFMGAVVSKLEASMAKWAKA